ncbi:MAG: DNA primase [Firmicutes bacterium]|nr:DNA primase [Bacillota bacterium]
MGVGYGPAREGRFSDEVLDEIRSRVDIVAVIGEYVQLKKRGSNFVGLCPFHQEKTPSFTVSPSKQMFYCFGCQTGGNVFTFLCKREGISFAEAVELLAARAGVALPERASSRGGRRAGAEGRPTPGRDGGREHAGEREWLLRVLAWTARWYRHQLLTNPEAERARAYLARRGVKPETVEKFQLGYSPDSWNALTRALLEKRVGEAVLERAGLALRGREGLYDRFRGRLMFTICDRRGRPVGFGARALDEGAEPKYLNSPETPLFSKGRVLYGLDLAAEGIRRRGLALVVEGYMDVIACHEHGFDFAVASMGTALTPDQARLMRYLTDTVVTAFDADSAGTLATLRGLEVLGRAGFKVKVAEIPGGKDPDECLRGPDGPEAFREAVDRAVPLVEYRFRLAAGRHDLTTVEGRVGAVGELLPVLAGIENRLELDEYVRDFARRLGVDELALRAELDRYLRAARASAGVRDTLARRRENRKELPPGRGPGPRQVLDAERVLLGYMLRSEEGLQKVLVALLEASDWCRAVGLPWPEDGGPGPGRTPAASDAASDEAAAALDAAAARTDPAGADAAAARTDPAGAETSPAEGEAPLTEAEARVLAWFGDPAHRRVVRALLTLARYGPVDGARLVDALAGGPEEDVKTASRALFEAPELPEEMDRAVRDCTSLLKEHRLNSRIDELHRRIQDLERQGAQVEREYAALLRELIDLERHTDGGTGHWSVPGD